ncbi:MAG: RNA polymerase sigma factor [Planctomycetota bacterium]|nr:RNA polymerase sigma factor [Planctomycetota bacterium]
MHTESSILMTRLHDGDLRAFDSLFRMLRGRAYHIAYSMVGSREDAMDLAQETFMRVYKARDSFDTSKPFLPWFHRILRNTCFSFLRKGRRVRERSIHQVDKDGDPIDFEIVDDGPDPSAHASHSETERLYMEAMGRLSARDREILTLRHQEELSYKDIAEALEIPEGTVMSRLFHARRRMRDALGPNLDPHQKTRAPQMEVTQ